MNNLEYLNEISKSNRPIKVAHKGPNPQTVLKIVIGCLVAFALIILVSIATNTGPKATDFAKQIYLRNTNLSNLLRDYNSYLKNSNLRAIGSSFMSAFSDANNKISGYLATHNISSTPNNDTANSEAILAENLNTTLTNAKLNGILDRIYLNQMQLQTSLLISLTAQAMDRAKNDTELLEILQQYSTNLALILNSLQNYSNPSA